MDSAKSKTKRNPRRVAKDRWEEEKLMTSDKSQLIDIDLVKLLTQPDAWECLEEAEKEEILELLPGDIHPNTDPSEIDGKIPPLSQEFLRYSTHWRSGIRDFQLDLQNGHYDPQWQREAEEAAKQRAAGKFDKFKEEEFEQFWGQKQVMDRSLAAGQSSRVKISKLISHGIIRKGDVWRWSRSFRKTLIDKEARIIDIKSTTLTFAVPPGQRVFLGKATSMNLEDPITMNSETSPTTPPLSSPSIDPPAAETSSDTKDAVEAGPSRKRSAEPETLMTVTKITRGRQRKRPEVVEEDSSNIAIEVSNPQLVSENCLELTSPNTENDVEASAEIPNGSSQPQDEALDLTDEKSSPPPVAVNGEFDDIILTDIRGPTALASKILEVDGRIKSATNGNAWKEIRCFRNNQDMGTLWEVRHAWWLKNK
ncbi:Asx homology domain-containing protein [Aspergillus californicus]